MSIIILLCIGILTAIIVLIALLIQSISKKRNCTLPIEGIIINIRQESSSMNSVDDVGVPIYRPIINYEYNGQLYTYYHTIAKTSYKNLVVGSKIQLKINPNNPKQVLLHI